MDRFANMQAFLRVAETGGFVAAARSLNVAPSVVTRRVGQLEDWLGVRLLHRTTRRVALSEEGATYAQHCARILAEVGEAEELLRSGGAEPRGSLRLAAPTSFGSLRLAPVLCELQALHPQLAIELILTDRPVQPLEEGFDAVVRDQPLRHPGNPLERELTLAPNRRVVCASPGYLQRRGTPERPADLARHDCIHYSYLPTGPQWSFGEGARVETVAITPRFASNNGAVMRAAALAGRGVVLLPSFLVEAELASGALVPLLGDYPLPLYWIVLVQPPAGQLSAKRRALTILLQARISAGTAQQPSLAGPLPPTTNSSDVETFHPGIV